MVGLMLLSEKHESLDFDLSMDIKSYSFKIQLIDLSLVRIFILCAFEGEDRWWEGNRIKSRYKTFYAMFKFDFGLSYDSKY